MQESTVPSQHGISWMQECSICPVARTEGLHSWMHHLISEHVLPTEWPSERVDKLTGPMAQKPYTAITQSKKKRKKDSIPRPLNSFMLFAQHIRRNVLRIFSDASNSYISQQLGDLWRSVSRSYRNMYDEEANRLVKIHQLEYPGYKYQPKKRQHQSPGVSATTDCTNLETRQSSDWINLSLGPSATPISVIGYRSVKSDECGVNTSSSSSLPQLSLKTENKSLPNSTSMTLSTVQSRLCIKPDSPPQLASYPRVSDSFTFDISEHENSPAFVTKSTFKRKRWESSGGRVESVRSSSFLTGNNHTMPTSEMTIESGMSSVLPPLMMSNSGRSYHDSAYASGINSSSSSSASSPAIGDVSPNKLTATYCSKASPTRHRFQFIPIRPRSQQAICIPGSQRVVRQRFLSANNDYCSLGTYDLTQSPLAMSPESPTESMLATGGFDAIDTQQSVPTIRTSAATLQSLSTTHGGLVEYDADVMAPVFSAVQTPGEQIRAPGQTVNSINRRVLVSNAAESPLPTGRLIQLLQHSENRTVNSNRQMGVQRGANQVLMPSTISPLTSIHQMQALHDAQSSPATNSSRLCGRFKNINGHLIKVSKIENNCASVSPKLVTLKDKPLVYQIHQHENGPPTVALLSNEPPASEESDPTVSLFDGTNAVLVDGIITDWWPNAIAVFDEDMPNNTQTTAPIQSVGLSPSEEYSGNVITVSSPSSDGRCSPTVEKTVTSSDPVSGVNDVDAESFDCNFDLMMNSIDISDFLPDPFPMNPNGIYDNQFATDAMTLPPGVCDDPNVTEDTLIPDISTILCHNTTKKSNRLRKSNPGDCDKETNGSSFVLMGDQFRQYKLDNTEVDCIDDHGVCLHSSMVQHDQADSLLSDLDALDKSSLFPLKPDWSILA